MLGLMIAWDGGSKLSHVYLGHVFILCLIMIAWNGGSHDSLGSSSEALLRIA